MSHWFPFCCPPKTPECGLNTCNFGVNDCTIPDPFILDLGAGGWTNLGCTKCVDVSGEFSLDYTVWGTCRVGNYCYWAYEYLDFCPPAMGRHPLRIGLYVDQRDAGFWRYSAEVAIGFSFPGDETARYASAETNDRDCMSLANGEGKIPLVKYYEVTGANCGGALPDTIYAWPDAWP